MAYTARVCIKAARLGLLTAAARTSSCRLSSTSTARTVSTRRGSRIPTRASRTSS